MAGRPNAVEISPYRKEIEEMLKEGKPDTFIAEWLKDKGHPISRQTINSYKNNKFNITLEAAKKYYERQRKKRLDEAAEEQVDDIEKIDEFIINVPPETIRDMDPKDQVRAVINFLKTKYQILGVIDQSKHVNVKVDVNEIPIPHDPQIRARGRDLIQQIRAGQMEPSNPGHGDQ